MGLKKKDLVLMGIILCIAAVCGLVHHFTGEAGQGIVAIKVDGVTEGTYLSLIHIFTRLTESLQRVSTRMRPVQILQLWYQLEIQ